jgi:hypothetical protein
MPTYTSPTDVSTGTLLSYSLLNTLFGTNGSLNYLYDGTNTNGVGCPPMFVLTTSPLATAVTATTTNVVFTSFTYGSNYWNGTQIRTSVCPTQSLTGRKFFILYQTNWAANTAGFRQSTISIATTNCTVDYSSYRSTRTPATTQPTTSGTTALVSFIDTANPASFIITFSMYQNSGGNLQGNSTLMICQLPST